MTIDKTAHQTRHYAQRLSPEYYTNEETYKPTRATVGPAVTLLRDSYASEGFFRIERERVFAKSWIPVGCTSQVQEPGQTFVAEVAVDPYGPESPDCVVGEDFARMWTSALSRCQERFEGKRGLLSKEPSGGIGCFAPDSFPVFDAFRQNAYVIADSNHGYKMIGVGTLVAKRLMDERRILLEPFRFSRHETGKPHPTSHSPFPWS